MDITIRNARHQDMEELIGLLHELFSIEADFDIDTDRQRRGLARMLDGCGKHRNVLVAEQEGRVVAMATAQLVVSTAEGALSAWIEDVVVAPSWRHQGIGARLLDRITAWAEASGAVRFQLLADRNNAPALSFYQTRGWRETALICLRKRPAP